MIRTFGSENASDGPSSVRQTNTGGWPSNGANMQSASTVILISPDETRHHSLTRAILSQQGQVLADFRSYPGPAHLKPILDVDCDAYVIEVDTDMDSALELVEAICTRKPSATVMVYSELEDPQRVMASMRAGAREFLVAGQRPTVLRDALYRAAVRRVETSSKKTLGKLMVFWGAKGGSGVTTVASNFAIALHQETGTEVVLVDLNPTLGDAALILGMTPRFTTAEAFQNPHRIDNEFVASLVAKHESGVSVIAAPDNYTPGGHIHGRDIARFLDTIRAGYPHVVVDAGPSLGAGADTLFQMATNIYLVTQLDIISLRNSQRLLSHIRNLNDQNIEVVINRYEPKRSEFDDDHVARALGRPPAWKVPNDYANVQRSANTGSTLMGKKNGVSQTFRLMARAACGKGPDTDKKKSWSMFG